MKTKFDQSNESKNSLTGPRYWRSLDEMTGQPEFRDWMEREFPQGASESEGVNRRHFLKIMAASFALAGAGATGCRRPEQYILPYSKQPEGTIPGLPVYYSTSFPDGKDSLPLVVETHQHRPTHLEGNGKYAPYGTALTAQASASVLNLYDPDRMTASTEGKGSGKRIDAARVADILAGVHGDFAATRGQGLAVLAEPSSSPTRERLVAQLREKMPRLLWSEYEVLDRDNPEKAAADVFGRPTRPFYRFEKAKRVLSVDGDFLHREAGSVGYARAFSKTRKVAGKDDAKNMSRLYAVESEFTLTGSMADHRLRLHTAEMGAFAALLAAELLRQTGGSSDLADTLTRSAGSVQVDPKWISECAKDLLSHKGHAVVFGGSHLSREVHQLLYLVNELIGAIGTTLELLEVPENKAAPIAELTDRIRSGQVDTLVILGGNPVYNAPADLGFGDALGKVKRVIRLGYYYDETALEADVNIATTHFLENWSDGRTYDGTYVPVQPMILPLFGGVSELEVIARLSGLQVADPYEKVRETFAGIAKPGAGLDKAFQRLLADGFLPQSSFPVAGAAARLGRLRELLSNVNFSAPAVTRDALEVRLVRDTRAGDGFYNNNGWLQELPDPITKLTWDNAICVSPKLAKELGFDTKSGEFPLGGGIAKNTANFKRGREQAPLATIELNGSKVTGPVHIQPGLADYTVVLPLGYGRRKVGRVGDGTGFDAYPLSSKDGFIRVGGKISLDTSRRMNLANTQQHWSMEGRAILREANVDTHLENSKWVDDMGMESHSPPIYGSAKKMPLAQKALETPRGNSAYDTPDFGAPEPNYDVWQSEEAKEKFIPEQQWGMTIDLNACTGCNACVIACQSENNIPIVGKDQVMRGREMHWIRLDRYYSSGELEDNQTDIPSDPQSSLMPLGCLHCEMAPCEQVCPVNATVHDKQGLNVMAYNRCVGTRYCANNCPYKVRRFNFFDYNKRSTDEFYKGPLGENKYKTEGGTLVSMQKNPDVTVRMRGVMEKCTYCVQRIEQAKIAQRVVAKDSNNINVPDGVIRMACQSACPTEAIAFGDISDPDTEVSKLKANDRDYSLLGYLNTRPRTTYLARLRNPNPAMPDAYKMPLSRKEYKQNQPEVSHGNGHGDAHGADHSANGHGDEHSDNGNGGGH